MGNFARAEFYRVSVWTDVKDSLVGVVFHIIEVHGTFEVSPGTNETCTWRIYFSAAWGALSAIYCHCRCVCSTHCVFVGRIWV